MIVQFPDLTAAAAAVAQLAAPAAASAAVPAAADSSGPLVVAVLPAAAEIGVAVAAALDAELAWVSMSADRSEGPEVAPGSGPPEIAGRSVVVVVLAVETGQEAVAVGNHLRERGAGSLELLAAVCPREAEPKLRACYADVRAVVRPLARRAAHWHFASLEIPTLEAARAIVVRQAGR